MKDLHRCGLMVCFLVVAVLLYCKNGSPAFLSQSHADAALSLPQSIDQQTESLLRTMTLAEKAGQIMIVGFDAKEINEHAASMVRKGIGGFIFFSRNMSDPGQVAMLSGQLQSLAFQQKNDLPLFICLDQEGGLVTRMREQVTPAPSQRKLATRGTVDDVFQFAALTGRELAAMGFNVNFAPVVDLSLEDSRSYGKSPDVATRLAATAVKAYAENGIVAALKHFPGIGKGIIDPHFERGFITAERATLDREDVEPFRRMIETVDNSEYFVMVSHLIYTQYDPDHPASISPRIMGDLLRRQLGYGGVIITDDMEMGALTQGYAFADMGYMALAAGADILLVCHKQQHQEDVINGVIQAVHNGLLSQDRLDDAVKRIIKLKLTKLSRDVAKPEVAQRVVGSAENRKILEDFNRRLE